MSRKKPGKRINKRQSVNSVLVNIQKMEKSLVDAPIKLVAQLNKEINAQKKKEVKLGKTINKVNQTMKKAESKINAIENAAKNTSASKKQLKKTKKAYDTAELSQSKLTAEIQMVTHIIESCTDKQNKLNALSKCLTQFEKDWIKSSKTSPNKAKSKKEKVKLAAVPSSEMDEVTQDNVTELAS